MHKDVAPVVLYDTQPENMQPHQSSESWDPPPHVYFGRKLANGKLEREPVYVYQEYPRTLYRKQADGTVRARTVNDAEQEAALGDGWTRKLGDLVVTCPSIEQLRALRGELTTQEDDVVPGLPVKGKK